MVDECYHRGTVNYGWLIICPLEAAVVTMVDNFSLEASNHGE